MFTYSRVLKKSSEAIYLPLVMNVGIIYDLTG
jgi:hypothetical protein